MIRHIGIALLLPAAIALMTACAVGANKESPPKTEAAGGLRAPATAPAQRAVAPVATPQPAPAVAKPATQPVNAAPTLDDPKSILSRRSVYYALDKADVEAEFRPLIEAHARYLGAHPMQKITIQGNCDERGSREYNIALGQRRAEGVMNMLKLLGVKADQMEVISFGEEKPKAAGHDEASWSENRRSDIVYQRSP